MPDISGQGTSPSKLVSFEGSDEHDSPDPRVSGRISSAAELADILDLRAQIGKLNITAGPVLREQLSVQMEDITPPQALFVVARLLRLMLEVHKAGDQVAYERRLTQ